MLTEHKLEILTVSIEEKETKTEAGKVVENDEDLWGEKFVS